MPVRKITISISPELDDALTHASLDQDEGKSTLIERFLREHKVVSAYVNQVRAESRVNVAAVRGSRPRRAIKPAVSSSE